MISIKEKDAKKLMGTILIIYTAMQSLPFFISNIIIYVALYILATIFMFFWGYKAIKKNYFVGFSIFWFCYGLVSYIWSKDSYLWFRNNMILIVIFLSILIFLEIVDSKEKIIYFSKIWTLTVSVAVLIGWYEIIFSNYHFTVSDKVASYTKLNWPLFSFANINDFSAYLTISIPIILLWIKNETEKNKKILGYIILVSTLLLITYMFSRGSLLAIVVGFVFLFILSHMKLTPSNVLLITFSFTIFFIALIIAYSMGIIDGILEQLIHSESRSDSLRMNLIKNGLKYLKNSNYLGIGAGNLEYYLPKFQYYKSSDIIYMHNWWVEVLVNYGIVVFIGYIVFWFKILLGNIKKTSNNENNISKYLAMAVVVFALAITSPSSIQLTKWLPVFTGFIVASTVYINS